jgi:hypothetical protein
VSNLTRPLPSLLRLSFGKHGALPDTTGKVPPPANEAQEAKEVSAPGRRLSYCHPWPSTLLKIGPHRVGPYTLCDAYVEVGRPMGTWVRYGVLALCLRHALALAGEGTE